MSVEGRGSVAEAEGRLLLLLLLWWILTGGLRGGQIWGQAAAALAQATWDSRARLTCWRRASRGACGLFSGPLLLLMYAIGGHPVRAARSG